MHGRRGVRLKASLTGRMPQILHFLFRSSCDGASFIENRNFRAYQPQVNIMCILGEHKVIFQPSQRKFPGRT